MRAVSCRAVCCAFLSVCFVLSLSLFILGVFRQVVGCVYCGFCSVGVVFGVLVFVALVPRGVSSALSLFPPSSTPPTSFGTKCFELVWDQCCSM